MNQMKPPPPASWQPELDKLAERKRIAQQIGGAELIARQNAGARLTVRERIDQCADPDSFLEPGSIAGYAAYDKTAAVMADSIRAKKSTAWPTPA